jgi:AcrR family transcriptional regulator
MPTPRRTSVEQVVRVGRAILEAEGLEGLTMQRVSREVGVRAPSLYRHVRDRDDLVRLIATDAVDELARRLDAAASSGDPVRDLRAMAEAHRAFAHEHPETYGLLFARMPERWRVDAELNARAARSLMGAAAQVAGEDAALEAARTFVAWAHGFVSMELADAFRLGGDVDEAFAFGIERLIVAIRPGTGSLATPAGPGAGATESAHGTRRSR